MRCPLLQTERPCLDLKILPLSILSSLTSSYYRCHCQLGKGYLKMFHLSPGARHVIIQEHEASPQILGKCDTLTRTFTMIQMIHEKNDSIFSSICFVFLEINFCLHSCMSLPRLQTAAVLLLQLPLLSIYSALSRHFPRNVTSPRSQSRSAFTSYDPQ